MIWNEMSILYEKERTAYLTFLSRSGQPKRQVSPSPTSCPTAAKSQRLFGGGRFIDVRYPNARSERMPGVDDRLAACMRGDRAIILASVNGGSPGYTMHWFRRRASGIIVVTRSSKDAYRGRRDWCNPPTIHSQRVLGRCPGTQVYA